MMTFALWLLQEPPNAGADNSTTIRVIAGVAALAVVAIILIRRKRKTSKEDWS